MNKTNGFREQAGASTSLYNKEQSKTHSNQRTTTSGLSFFKWFKKNDKSTIDSRSSTKSIGRSFNFKSKRNSHHNISHETLSPSSSPNLQELSPSSSCDSIKSTSTTGFAFIKPNNYRPSNGIIAQRSISTQEFDETSSNRTISNAKPDLTLRRKYCLYDTDTLTSTEGDYDNIRFGDRSLPHLRKNWRENQATTHRKRRARRAVSDSCKDKKSGAYVHVKGKRKAPAPPSPPLANGGVSTDTVNRTSATLNRKKRRAPPPPYPSNPQTVSNLSMQPDQSDELLDDMDIKALIRSSTPNTRITDPQGVFIRSSAPQLTLERADFTAAEKLTEQQRQAVLDNIVRVTQSASSSEGEVKASPPPASPISPRPWYKRPISCNRDSSVPFKREIVLKTMEKRKVKQKEKTSKTDNASESGHSRSSLFEASSKFGFFLRGKDNSEKDKEKRRSAIGIPNISELDREAAEIVHREYANAQAAEQSETDKFFAKSDHILLQQEMFGSGSNIELGTEECKEDEEQEDVIRSAKDLITKFEASSNGPRITLNTSFIGRKENFLMQDSKQMDNNIATNPNETDENHDSSSPPQQPNSDQSADRKTEGISKEHITPKNIPLNRPILDSSAISKISWTCAFCTLENPGWRIICEVCERIKPYGKRTSIGDKLLPNNKSVDIVQPTKGEIITRNLSDKINNSDQPPPDWDKKTEKVLKYFMPKTTNNGPLMKSSSETSVGKKQLLRKSPSPGKPPSGSPQLGFRNKLSKANSSEIVKPSAFPSGFKSASTIFEEKENLTPLDEQKRPLLDTSVIVTTVTPVFWAGQSIPHCSDASIVGEIRKPYETEASVSKSEPTVEDVKKTAIDRQNDQLAFTQHVQESGRPVESTTLNLDEKIDIKEVRKARLARFAVPELLDDAAQPISSPTRAATQVPYVPSDPIPIYDHDTLEREKKRLRDMIQAMNAKALAEKYPTDSDKSSSPTLDGLKQRTPPLPVQAEAIQVSEKKSPPADQAKLGAIKKVFAKTRTSGFSKQSPDPVESVKPKKVSTSVQTTGVTKKSLTPDDVAKPGSSTKMETIYANVPIYENSPLEKYDRNMKLTENDKVKVQEISQQLTSVQGINDFKESLKHTPTGISATDTIALSKIMRNLETAIAEGQHELAAQIAIDLARMKVSLHVTKQKDRLVSRTEVDFEKNIIVDMFVEDKYSQKGPIQIAVTPLFTIVKLKQKIAIDFDIPVGVQRWLINDDLALDDNKTLLEFGVKDHTATFYLYIIAPDIHFYEVKKTNIESNQLLPKVVQTKVKTSQEITAVQRSPPITHLRNAIDIQPNWACTLCTLINPPEKNVCLACTKPKPKQKQLFEPIRRPMVQLRPAQKRNDLNKVNPNRRSTDVFNIVDLKIDVKQTAIEQINHVPNAASPNITRNRYRGVDNFNANRKKGPAPKPNAINKLAKINATPGLPKNIQQNVDHYMELLNLDNADIVPNLETFECPICFMKFDTGEGAILRDCLHTFCKDCLGNTVQYSEDAEVKCPYMDADYSCDSVLQEREVRALVSKDIYELHLVKSMRVAEHQIENAFHCKTPNCRGWCIYEDNVNEFKCPVCKITNCLTCRVIHDGLTCKQFQDRLNSDCDSNIDAKQTKAMLEEMVKNGEAMNCPTCQVIMMKKWGCDWLKCSMCKTEVCWVTRGPRWGPGGKGDTSAGCRCGVNSVKCHPKCNYCH